MQGITGKWASKQPQEALAWATSTLPGLPGSGWNLHQSLLEGAWKTLPDLDRDTLARMLPDGPAKATMPDLAEAARDPPFTGQPHSRRDRSN